MSVEKIHVALKTGKNNGYFIRTPIHISIILRSFLFCVRNVSDKSCRGIQNIHFMFNNFFSS